MLAPLVSKFLKVLKDIDPSKHRTEVFSDFCELAFCVLAKAASPHANQRETLEKQYMNVVGRYRNKDDVRKMPELLAFCMETIHQGGLDFLGTVAGELGALEQIGVEYLQCITVLRAGLNGSGYFFTLKVELELKVASST